MKDLATVKYRYAWVRKGERALRVPVTYEHASSAVI